MPVTACPKCQREIPDGDINVSTDIAFCRHCDIAHAFSELLQRRDLSKELDGKPPPDGVSERTTARGVAYVASHRSIPMALGALAVSLFWNGIVSVFVVLNLASTLNLLGVPVPAWFPAPLMNGDTMGWGITLFLWLFLTPFMLIGATMIGAFFMALGGRTEIRINPDQGRIFTGIGAIGRTRKFSPHQVRQVILRDKTWRDSDGDRQQKQEIILEMAEGDDLKLGAGLQEARRTYLAALLQRTLCG